MRLKNLSSCIKEITVLKCFNMESYEQIDNYQLIIIS